MLTYYVFNFYLQSTDDDYFENVLLILTCFCIYSLLYVYHGEWKYSNKLLLNPFYHNVEKWQNIPLMSCDIHVCFY